MSIQSHFFSKPKTKLGVWAVALTIIFLVMMTINNAVLMGLPENLRWRSFLILYGFVLLGCGLAAGIVAPPIHDTLGSSLYRLRPSFKSSTIWR